MYLQKFAVVVSLFVLAGCGKEADPKNAQTNGSNQTNGLVDMAQIPDMGSDVGTVDVGAPDLGAPVDMADAGSTDAGMPDLGPDMGGPCSRNGFMLAEQAVDFDSASNFLIYSGFNETPDAGVTYDKLSFEIYPDFGGMFGAQEYTFPGQNYSECGTCLLIFADCTMGVGCDKTFLVDSGSVSVAAAGSTEGDAFGASFSDLVFSEVTLDADFVSTKVVGGETYCIDMLDASGTTVVF